MAVRIVELELLFVILDECVDINGISIRQLQVIQLKQRLVELLADELVR